MKTPRFWLYDGVVPKMLAPISFIYNAVTQARIKNATPYRSKAYVICVGNITAGGVGKTPVALALGEQYLKEGKKVFYVTRGYKGKLKNIVVDLKKHSAYETGDEARLLAMTAPTIINPNRAEGAKMAEELGAEIIIMDDGFQNPSLYKDESWLVFDGEIGTGNGKILPAGPLRETLETGEKRAARMLIMGEDKTGLALKTKLPVYFGRLQVLPFELEKGKVFAFAGIGRPEKFYRTLQELGFEVAMTEDFEDHHAYGEAELDKLIDKAKKAGFPLVTTEKDYVKIPAVYQKKIHCLKVRAVWEEKQSS